MTEKAYIIYRINEVANEMIRIIPSSSERREFARLLNNHIVDTLANLSSVEKMNRNHLVFHTTEELIFLKCGNPQDSLIFSDEALDELYTDALEIDRLMSISEIL